MSMALSKEKLKTVYAKVAGRYDLQHGILTAYSDRKGREILVDRALQTGNRVLDCGSGTGSTALLAARKVGPGGRVVLFDLSDAMLDEARKKLVAAGLIERCEFVTGDMHALPFESNTFDVVLSAYSLGPLRDPVVGALECVRVSRPGGRIGIAHSDFPTGRLIGYIGRGIERLIWKIPALSLGCRPVSVLSTLVDAGCRILSEERIGIVFWPFLVFVVEKPED